VAGEERLVGVNREEEREVDGQLLAVESCHDVGISGRRGTEDY